MRVGLGRLSCADVAALLAAKERQPGGGGQGGAFRAPAHGLCLERCFYEGSREEWRAESGVPWARG